MWTTLQNGRALLYLSWKLENEKDPEEVQTRSFPLHFKRTPPKHVILVREAFKNLELAESPLVKTWPL